MAFFDPKEDVIDLEITPFGKQLLKDGKFKPEYYAFFDDDVLYDSAYLNISESQNSIQTRIKEETPRLKAQAVYSGIETNITRVNKLVRSGKLKFDTDEFQPTADKNFSLVAPLGNFLTETQYKPAWNLKYLKGEFSGSLSYSTGSFSTLRIPQLTSSLNFKTFIDEKQSKEKKEVGYYNKVFSDGSSVRVEEDYLLFEIGENNTQFSNENFDIEVFILEEESESKVKGGKIDHYIPLSFVKKENESDSSLLLEEEIEDLIPEVDNSFVEYFLDILTDSEIDKEIMCKLVHRDRKKDLFADDLFDCDEPAGEEKDIYNKEIKDFEECDE